MRPICSAAAALVLAFSAAATPESLDNFRLLDRGGFSWELYRADAAGVVALCVVAGESDASKAALATLNTVATATPAAEVFALDVAPPEAGPRAGKEEPGVPVLRDTAQDIARDLGVSVVGETILAVPSQAWRVVHRGTVATLADDLKAVLDGRAPTATAVQGEALALAPLRTYDYASDVAPVLAAKCLSCHTRDGVAPFAFSGHASAKKWARMTREVVRTAQMPPWHADPHYGTWLSDRGLTREERQALLGWIAQGAVPAADGRDPLAEAAAAKEPKGWALGEPDLVLQLPEAQQIPAEGVVPYQYITVPTGLTEDKWLRAFEVRPTALSTVHHALIFVVYPKEYRHLQPEAEGGLEGYFAAYLPGMVIKPYPDQVGQFLPRGSALIFQMHYNTTGTAQQDQTQIGLYFHAATPARALSMTAAYETEFRIPPQVSDHKIRAAITFENPVELWGLSPHMHYRGARARFDLTLPGSDPRTLLNVPFYQFDWQPLYVLDQPLPLPAGSKITVTGAFDNSKYNPKNPDPGDTVYFGEQSYEEMYIGYIAVTEPVNPEKYASRAVDPGQFVGGGTPLTADTLVGTRWLFEDMDPGDTEPYRAELALHRFGIATIDGIPGTWKLNQGTVTVGIPFDDPFPLTLVNDELFWTGLPLKRLK